MINENPESQFVPQVILIGGCQRSGTSLINKLLNGHPAVHSVMTDHAVLSDYYEQFACLCGIEKPTTTEEMIAALQTILKLTPIKKWEVSLEEVSKFVTDYFPSWDSIYLAMLDAVHDKHPDCRICLKCPGSEKHFVHLKNLFESRGKTVHFIYCVRSPFDAYLSWKHRAHAPGWRGATKVDSDPIHWSSIWLESTGHALHFKHMFPDHLRILRFVDTLANPCGVSAELCRFIGLQDCSERMIQLNGHASNSSFDTSAIPAVAGGVLNVKSKCRAVLPEREADVLRVACRQRATLFGYDLGSPKLSNHVARLIEDEVKLDSIPTWELITSVMNVVSRRLGRRLPFHKQLT